MRHGNRFARPAAALIVVTGLGFGWSARAQRGPQNGEWPEYAGDTYGLKYSPLAQINKDNIRQLRVAWRWTSADRDFQIAHPELRATRNEDTPLVVKGVLYTVTPLGMVAALDPATGQQRWLYDPEVYKAGKPGNSGFIHRGLAYWSDGKVERLLHGTDDAYLISIDVTSGKPDPAFGTAGRVDLTEFIPRAVRSTNFAGRRPLIAGNVVIVGNAILDPTRTKEMPPGHVQAFDVRTGKRLWTFHTVPTPGEFGHDTWLEDSAEFSGNTNVWSGMTYDPDLDYVYLPVTGATGENYGGHRPGNNLFAETLVCVEAKTGKRVWHFQIDHHGLWDYDLPAHPILGDITVDGRRIKAVIQVTKQGFTFAFDRKTGAPVWPIEERPVPQSTVPGERTSPTQPFPTKPPPFTLQGSTEENLIDFTPALRQQALEHLQQFVHGPIYTPPSEQGTLFLPGVFGGANWGGGGFDPDTGILYVPSRMTPGVSRLVPADPKATNFRYQGGAGPNPSLTTIQGLSIFKPPYSKITAIDMNTGEILWETAIGHGPRHHPLLKDLNPPPLGDFITRLGVLVTKTLVFVNAQRLESLGRYVPPPWKEWGDPDMDRKLLYVFDKQSGKVLREIELDGLSAAVPMTYVVGGKQYIAVATGGGETSEVVALSLQDSP
jgi:quinoprotein glucose dehydrogenase